MKETEALAYARNFLLRDYGTEIKKETIDLDGTKYYRTFRYEWKWEIDCSESEFLDRLNNLFNKKERPIINSKSIEHETWLNHTERENVPVRFECYCDLLTSEGMENLVPKIKAETSVILDNCQNPKVKGLNSYHRSGLVYGYVQSGKTANYLGLINRAFDAGYKQVVILTGVIEDLRRQTQKRVDYSVVGRNSNSPSIGIKKCPNSQVPI